MSSYKNDIDKLASEINQHDYCYYALDNPTISDLEYDKKYKKLLELEKKHNYTPANSPTQRVSGVVSKRFGKSSHTEPMLSIQNCFLDEELVAFDSRVRKFLSTELAGQNLEYFCQPKLDGLAMELVYENGKLTKAITRGDGYTGENVTENIKTIKCIPLYIADAPNLLEVRGEVIMKKNDFRSLNKIQEAEEGIVFSTPRNAAAGSVRQLNSAITAQRKLFFYAYACGSVKGVQFETHKDMEERLRTLGIPILPVRKSLKTKAADNHLSFLANSLDEAIQYRNFIYNIKPSLDFDVDGVVIKVNRINWQRKIGMTAKYPRWVCAAKFKAEEAKTRILDIKVQVGRTGVLTPVAILEPVRVAGVLITYASLHNQDEIDRKDIRISDTVNVQRAGDVIPYITGVEFSKRKKGAAKYTIPDKCPSCNKKADKSETLIRCKNSNCGSQLKQKLKHFVSRRAMNIDQLGDKLVEKLSDANLVKNYSDFYKLKEEHILGLEGYKDKSANNIISSIQKTKKQRMDKFIYALGIRHVGENTAKLIAKHFKSIDKFLSAKEEDFSKIDGLGDRTSHTIAQYLSGSGMEEIKKLMKVLELSYENYNEQNKTVVLTGRLSLPKHQIKEILEAKGFNVLNSVSKNTDFVLYGEKAGTKLDTAKRLGIQIIDESTIDWNDFNDF